VGGRGASVELNVRLNVCGPERYRLGEDTIELIRRLAEHHPDRQIAQILARQGTPDRDRPAVHRNTGESRAPARRHSGGSAPEPR
jgi:hypothetical protein